MNASVPLISLPGGRLLIPADEVTALLRHLASGWLRSVSEGEIELDPGTTLGLAGVLMELADQIDVECIAFMPVRNEDEGEDEGDA
ncbi:DUF6213 family protein [Streptomyces sp. APSN-46.1]|uniref:DUF6213 family protein n=1 Tax=Streptomyces sp. APSN-46.1 TaxID=2929049 RepID=UPI001FB35A6D|nr:DUF6213 family protein [Streptomyces sp. APSN-46.1]MCJ1678486.1 DUF6213 family protein [Streptomyces sp. APSN-46.1]